MAETGSKSKKQFAANSPSKPPDERTFFLDRSLGKKVIAEALRAAGLTVEVHDDHFPTNARDEDWLKAVGNRKWVVLSKDDQIRYHPMERDALLNAGVMAFFLPRGDLKGDEMAAIFLRALPRIKRFLKKYKPPIIGKVTRGGDVSILGSTGWRTK